MIRTMRALGVVLLLGGLAHSAGVVNLYVTHGVPDANRVLLDVWIAQAQLLAGGAYVAAARRARPPKLGSESASGGGWRGLAIFAALTIIGFSIAMLPVLVARAPLYFSVPPIVYSIASAFVIAHVIRT